MKNFFTLQLLFLLSTCDNIEPTSNDTVRKTFNSIWNNQLERDGLNAIEQHNCPKVLDPKLTFCRMSEDSNNEGLELAMYYELEEEEEKSELGDGILEQNFILTLYIDNPEDSLFVKPLGCGPGATYFDTQGLEMDKVKFIYDFDSIYSMKSEIHTCKSMIDPGSYYDEQNDLYLDRIILFFPYKCFPMYSDTLIFYKQS